MKLRRIKSDARRPREVANSPRDESEDISRGNPPSILGIIPANSWVCEKREEDGTVTVMPLCGWLVTDDLEVQPIPGLGPEWIVRPLSQNDERLIRLSASRLRLRATDQRSYYYQ